jgi:formylglycine-generating enzyme required for sulfatase activity
VLRGGDWYDFADSCRTAYRNYRNPPKEYDDLGFRSVLPSGQ